MQWWLIRILISVWLRPGENPSLVPLLSSEFWVQIHNLPPGLMTEAMARQFGDFLGRFLDYDTTFRSINFQSFMHIRVQLDVTIPLKRKKKVMVGTDRTFYALFKYEKLSLFCFICGKLGHGESFCHVRIEVDPSKIIFGWDVTLCATARQRLSSVSRWLSEADRSERIFLEKKMESCGRNQGNTSDSGNICRDDLAKIYPNPNLIPLGPGQSAHVKGLTNWSNVANQAFNNTVVGHGPRELQLDEENDPLLASKGKKC
ncbi:hypothetical protein J1N35_011975 [Gossypium stocksii]|uniref:Zinc knuckle CX2CX4HX4C domain-containing protein n=1 Tax=Gossypium stocksii TaxID=47602 RepID=A0A9D4ABY4_9ROSI|nr:hypothetical protein J1N35_011975 [Gossypium stocksii]